MYMLNTVWTLKEQTQMIILLYEVCSLQHQVNFQLTYLDQNNSLKTVPLNPRTIFVLVYRVCLIYVSLVIFINKA